MSVDSKKLWLKIGKEKEFKNFDIGKLFMNIDG